MTPHLPSRASVTPERLALLERVAATGLEYLDRLRRDDMPTFACAAHWMALDALAALPTPQPTGEADVAPGAAQGRRVWLCDAWHNATALIINSLRATSPRDINLEVGSPRDPRIRGIVGIYEVGGGE